MSGEKGSEEEQNCVGELSLEEAEKSYIECKGNMKDAIEMCVNNRKELVSVSITVF